MFMVQEPNSAAMPRPGNQPFYIEPHCPQCQTKLVLSDLLEDHNADPDTIWYDEWQCPTCRNGLHMDWPPQMVAQLNEQRLTAVPKIP